MDKKKVVLAYSGGLDTSVILKWFIEEGYDVVAYLADVGQDEDLEAAKAKALAIGAASVYVEDLREEFITEYIFPSVQANAVYESRYLLGTSVARPVIAKRQIEIAQRESAECVSHGSTGKGNDQVRFELSYYALQPGIKVLAPWKMPEFLDKFRGRGDMLEYADRHGIPVKASRSKPYSEDENILHISHEAGILEDPDHICEEEIYSHTTSIEEAPDKADMLELTFKDGLPVKAECEGRRETEPLPLFAFLNEIGAKHGIGRVDMVENRFVGIKSRGVYETPGGTILHAALRDLEGLTMDREVMHLRDDLAPRISRLMYNGFWFCPEMELLLSMVRQAQENVDGEVTLKLYKGRAYPVARKSDKSLYDEGQSSMDEHGGFDQHDSDGFIKINAVRLRAYYSARGRK